MVVLMEGGALGVKLAISIATLLIIVLGLQEVVDLILKLIPKITGQPISINRVFRVACFAFHFIDWFKTGGVGNGFSDFRITFC